MHAFVSQNNRRYEVAVARRTTKTAWVSLQPDMINFFSYDEQDKRILFIIISRFVLEYPLAAGRILYVFY